MLLYLTVTVVVLILGYFVNGNYRKEFNMCTAKSLKTCGSTRQEALNRVLLFAIFMIFFLLAALRVGTGNDYWVYRTGFLQVFVGDTPVSYEIGFNFVVKALQYIFYRDCYIIIFAFFAFFIAYFFVKGLYDVSDWFVYTLFLFMANGFYFMSFSNVRYYLAFGMCVCSIRPLLNKNYTKFVLYIIIASLFHRTALVCIPVYLIAYFIKWTKRTVWLIPAAAGCLFFGKALIKWVLTIFYPYYADYFGTYDFSYINILKSAAVLVFCLIFYKPAIKGDTKAEFFFNLNLFALILYAFASYVPELSRICYYMVLSQMFLIPEVLIKIENKKWRRIFSCAIILAFTGYYIMFLIKGADQLGGIRILPYLSWIFG